MQTSPLQISIVEDDAGLRQQPGHPHRRDAGFCLRQPSRQRRGRLGQDACRKA